MNGPTRLIDLLEPHSGIALTRATGRDSTTVSKWKRGERLPGVADLEPLAGLLGVDVLDLTRLVAEETSARREAPGAA